MCLSLSRAVVHAILSSLDVLALASGVSLFLWLDESSGSCHLVRRENIGMRSDTTLEPILDESRIGEGTGRPADSASLPAKLCYIRENGTTSGGVLYQGGPTIPLGNSFFVGASGEKAARYAALN